MKEKLLTIMFSLFCFAAAVGEPLNYLVIWSNNGGKSSYKLDDHPKIEFKETSLVITINGAKKSFPIKGITRFTYESSLLGDSNIDDKVDVADITTTINYITKKEPQNFSFKNADVYADNNIDYKDINNTVELILNEESNKQVVENPAIGNAFYIYRNDNCLNAFFRNDVDSISFSNYDKDGILYERAISQAVYTKDSVFIIPIENIDSIGYVTPKTIYQPGVVVLKGDLRNYIKSRDGLSLSFLPSTPESLLPKIGDKLVTTEVDEIITNAFIGQVANIDTKADGIEIGCEPVKLTDVFECYYGIIQENEKPILTRGLNLEEGFWGTDGTRTLSPGKLAIDLNTHDISITYNKDDELSYSVDNAQASLSLTPVIDYSAFLIVSKDYGVNVSITAVGNYTLEELFELSGNLDFTAELPLFKKTIPVPEVLLDFEFEFGLFSETQASLIIEQIWTQKYRHFFHWEWSSRNHESLQKVHDFVNKSNTHTGKVALNGSIAVGGYGKVGIAFIATSSLDIAEIGLKFKGGFNLEGTYVPYKRDAEYAKTNTDLYNQIKDREISVYGFRGLTFEAKLFKWSVSKEIPNFFNIPINNKELKAGYRSVPLFSNTKLKKDKGEVYLASSIVSGEVQPTDIGFALINKSNNEDAIYSYSVTGYIGPKDFPYSSSFNRSYNNQYILYPLVKYMNMDMIAEPFAEVFNTTITTFSALNIKTTTATLNGFVENYDKEDESIKFVFLYSTSEDVLNSSDGRTVVATCDDNGNLTADISNLTDNTTYYYAAAYKEGNSDYVLGEIKSFTTKSVQTQLCPDNNHPHLIDLGLPSGTKWACCNVGASKPEGYGSYFAWGEVNEKNYYYADNYQYAIEGVYSENNYWYDMDSFYKFVNIGDEIAGSQYDAANVKWGVPWQMPTYLNYTELLNNTSYKCFSVNGVRGHLITSSNGASLFFPAAGSIYKDEFSNENFEGQYWSATVNKNYPQGACRMGFEDPYDHVYINNPYDGGVFGLRFIGMPIRPVQNGNN